MAAACALALPGHAEGGLPADLPAVSCEAFIILDEAQNSTRSQMKMFLTRMGFHSKIVITGDITQFDLIRKKDSGLLNAKILLDGIEGNGFVELTSLDVVRHPLVQKIVQAYDDYENKQTAKTVRKQRKSN